MKRVAWFAIAVLIAVCTVVLIPRQTGQQANSPQSTTTEAIERDPGNGRALAPSADAGLPVQDPLLRKACAIDAAGGSDGSDASSHEHLLGEVQEFAAMIDATSEYLSNSPVAEHRHAAALLVGVSNPERRTQLFEDALDAEPSNAHLLFDALDLCLEQELLDVCPLAEWGQALRRADNQNGETWRLIAEIHYRQGDAPAALAAIQRAVTSPVTNSYYFDRIEVFERALSAVGNLSYFERAGLAIAMANMTQSSYAQTVQMCQSEAPGQREWGDACLEFGVYLERASKTLMGEMVGLNMQRLVLENKGRMAEWERAVEKLDGMQPSLVSFASRHATLRNALRLSTSRAFADYLAIAKTDGEAIAEANLTAMTADWLQLHPECLQ